MSHRVPNFFVIEGEGAEVVGVYFHPSCRHSDFRGPASSNSSLLPLRDALVGSFTSLRSVSSSQNWAFIRC